MNILSLFKVFSKADTLADLINIVKEVKEAIEAIETLIERFKGDDEE